jgi:hypothetical protein
MKAIKDTLKVITAITLLLFFGFVFPLLHLKGYNDEKTNFKIIAERVLAFIFLVILNSVIWHNFFVYVLN